MTPDQQQQLLETLNLQAEHRSPEHMNYKPFKLKNGNLLYRVKRDADTDPVKAKVAIIKELNETPYFLPVSPIRVDPGSRDWEYEAVIDLSKINYDAQIKKITAGAMDRLGEELIESVHEEGYVGIAFEAVPPEGLSADAVGKKVADLVRKIGQQYLPRDERKQYMESVAKHLQPQRGRRNENENEGPSP